MREYLPILLFLLVAIAFAGGTILLSSLIVPRRRNAENRARIETIVADYVARQGRG